MSIQTIKNCEVKINRKKIFLKLDYVKSAEFEIESLEEFCDIGIADAKSILKFFEELKRE